MNNHGVQVLMTRSKMIEKEFFRGTLKSVDKPDFLVMLIVNVSR
jgi:hypothetical protein